MNHKSTVNGGQDQGWVTLDEPQLRRIDGGVEQLSLGFTPIKSTDFATERTDVAMLLPAVQAAREAAR